MSFDRQKTSEDGNDFALNINCHGVKSCIRFYGECLYFKGLNSRSKCSNMLEVPHTVYALYLGRLASNLLLGEDIFGRFLSVGLNLT